MCRREYIYQRVLILEINLLQKINNKEKVKMKENRCIELKTVRETMVAFGIL